MSKEKTVLYFQKQYSLLLHSLSVSQRVSIATLGGHSAHKQLFERALNYSLNQVVDISCVDMVQNGTTVSDNQPLVSISTYDNREGKRIEIVQARFDMNFQKIIKADSSVMYAKQLQGGRGTLSYKFISVKTKTLSEQEYQSGRRRKEAIQVELFKDEQSLKIKNLMKVLSEKNGLVEELQKRIQELIVETNRRGIQLANERQRAIDKKIELSMKVNPIERHLKHQNETLKAALEEEIEKSRTLEWKMEAISDERDAIERSLVMSKKQYDKLNDLFKSSKNKKTILVSGVKDKPQFLQQSLEAKNVAYQSSIQEEKGAKISVLEPPEEPRRRRNTIAETPSMLFGGIANSYMKNSKRLDTVVEEETNRLNEQPMKTSSYVPKDGSFNIFAAISREEPSSPSRYDGSKARIEQDLSRERINEVSRRISMQKDDLKLTSIIFQKDQELILLQKKCQLFQAQTKQLEKQLDRYQQMVKKKEMEIRQLKKRSKKNLLLEVSSRDLKTSKNRPQIQAHFQKLQEEYESQKLVCQQEIDKLEKEMKIKNKEIKDLKISFEETALRQKTLAEGYKKLKIANKKAGEQIIQYKEKSMQYDKLVLAGRQLETENKAMKERLFILQDQNTKLDAFYTKANAKSKEQEKQLEKLRKVQRQYDYIKNQNTNLKNAIENFEVRYSELKKYCLKIEAAYSKFISRQKKGGSSSGIDWEEDKQIHGKFAQLNKKVNECELSYFKQQLQDYKDESQFVRKYYQKKKLQQKSRIMDSKDMSQEMKQSELKAKDIEYENALNQKLQQINSKIHSIEKSLVEVQHRSMEGSQTFIESVPEKMKKIQMRVSTIVQREHQREKDRLKLKDTIQNLQEEMKLGKSNVNLLASGHATSQKDLLQSMINQNRQRKTMLEEARLKSEQVQLKAYEQNRKLNTSLMKENHETKSQLSKLKMESERAQRKAQEREKNMEAAFKKSQYEYKLKIDKLTEDLEKAQIHIDKLKEDRDEQRSGVSKLQTQMTHLSSEVEDKDIQIGLLNQQIDTLQRELNDCRVAERQMKEEVEQIKAKAELTEKQFLSLIDARSADFLKIEQLKETQNQKLKAAITMLEQSLEAQMYENMKHISSLEKQKEEMEKYQKQSQAKIQDYVLALENRSKELDDLYLKEVMVQKQNETLKTTLIDISSEIQNKQVQNVELHYKIQSLQKQIRVYQKQAPQYEEMEKKLKGQIQDLNATLKDKNYQLKYFQEKFMRIQTEIQLSAKELERLSALNSKYQETIGNWQDKYSDKQEEIIKLKEDNSLAKIEIEKIKLVYSGLGQENQTLKAHIQELQAQINQLHQTIKKIQEEKDDLIEQAKNSRRSSRSKSPVKRAASIQVSHNDTLGFGGITPINPAPIKTFPGRMNSLDSNKDLLQVPRKQSKELKKNDQTQIQINIQDPDISHIPQPEDHSQLLMTNVRSLMQTNIGNNNQLIVEESDEHKEGSYAYSKNIDLQDHEQSNEENVQELRKQIDEMQEEIDRLKQDLAYTTEQNQKLNNQIGELEGKIYETSHLGPIQSNNQLEVPNQPPIRKQTSQLSRPSHLEISLNKTSLNRSSFGVQESNTYKEIRKSSEPQSPLPNHRQRSNSGVEYSKETEYLEMKEKYNEADLEIQQLKDTIIILKNEIQAANQGNQKIILEMDEYADLLQQKEDELEQAHFEVEQYKKFQVFEEYYKQETVKVQDLSLKIEELTAQTLQKDEKMTQLLKESNQIMNQVTLTRGQLTSRQEEIQALSKKIKVLNDTISKNKREYRQYEQSAELEIMHLKQEMDQLKVQSAQKDEDKVFLGSQYVDLQNQKEQIKKELEQLKRQISKQSNNVQLGENKMNELEVELQKSEKSRQEILKSIKKLQIEIMEKSQTIKNMTNDSILASKKFQIKFQSTQQEHKLLTEKLQQKEKVISLLKNEIALYNQQSSQLRKSNDALQYQIDKVEKELKDIMQVYNKQIEGMHEGLKEKDHTINQLKNQLLGKSKGEDNVMKQMRKAEKERDLSKHQLIEVKSILDKVKSSKVRELTEAHSKYQFKADQCQKVKAALEKINSQLAIKEQQIVDIKKHFQNQLQGYKQRYSKYEESIIELQLQLEKVKDRPTVEAYEQTLFQNQLLRNEVQDLREQNNKASSRSKEQQIFIEFKKYKRTREQEIQDLRSQMERYGVKIGQMQECIVDLRKENQLLRQNNQILIQQRDEFQAQCEDLKESMVDIEKELEFYKKRKMLDMQKLLNQTH